MGLFRAAVVFVIAGAHALAQETVPLDALVAEALRNNPEVLAAQKRYEALRQRPAQESALADPMLSLGYASVGSPLPGAGLGREPMARAGVMFSQEIPYPGKRKLRGEIAEREADTGFQDYQAVQLNVAARVKQAYFHMQRDHATRATLERNRDLLRKFLRISEARYGVGQGAQADIFKAQTQLSILETRLTRLQQDIESRQAEINSLLNRQSETPLPAPQESEPKPLIESLEGLTVAARENSPLLARDQKTIERTELALNLARKEYYPDFTVSGGYYSMGSMGNMYEARVDFRLPLYFWRKQRAAVAERASLAGEARRAYEAAGRTLEFRIKDDYLMAQTSYKLMELYGKTVIPQASLALESSLTSYQTGAVDFLTVLTNFMTLIEYEINYQEEVAAYQQALARLEEMTGTRLIR
jgi:outer membrane protein TolC